MTLWEKSLRVIGVSVLLLVSVLYLLQRAVLRRDFSRLERENLEERLQTARYVVDLELEHLQLLSGDWAVWDDMYEFAVDRNAEFLATNLPDRSLEVAGLNLMVIVDAAGQVLYARGYDPLHGGMFDLPEVDVTGSGPLAPLLGPADEGGRSGLVMLESGAMLAASRSTLTSLGQGPARGTVIVGRLLEERAREGLSEIARLPLRLRNASDESLTADERARLAALAPGQSTWIESRSGSIYAGHLLLRDMAGQPAVVLTLEPSPESYNYAQVTFYSLGTMLVVGALGLFLAVLLGIEVTVLSRINALRRQVAVVSSSADPTLRVKLDGRDEVADLAQSINVLLAGLEEAHRSFAAQQQELRESERRYRTIFETAGTANVILDEDGTVLLVNPEFEHLYGYSREELEGKRKWSEFVQPSDVQRMREYQLRRLREPSAVPRSYEYKGYDRQGNLRDVLLTASVIPGTRRTLANLLDITERKRMEEELRRLKDFNEGIVEGMAEGLVLEDSEGRITFVNRALETMLGYQRAELIGWSWTQLVAPDHTESIRARMAGRREGASEVYESYFLDKGGQQVPVLISARALMEGGRYHGSLSAITDMREREQLEEQLRQAQKLEMLGVIAGGVAHSFNNLLTVIRGNAQLVLAEEGLTEQLRHDLEVIDGAAQRGALLTQQLLTFSRRRVLQPVATDLNRLVRDFVQLIGPVLGGDITVQTGLATAALPVLADASAVEQVLMNLSVNARDAMPDGGTLTFETAAVGLSAGAAECRPSMPPGDYVRVSVTDTGQGMGPDVIAHLFEPFYSTKEVGRGTGLGLSVAYGIVQQHQGCIEVQSAPGQGARFDIYFPARAADQPRKQEG